MKRTLIVTGAGRCGTTLTMQMLDLGGLPVLADNVGMYEVPGFADLEDPEAFAMFRMMAPGRGVKVLDPRLSFDELPATRGGYVVIHLERDHREQARSLAKTMACARLVDDSLLVFDDAEVYPLPSRKLVRRLKSQLKEWARPDRAASRRLTADLLTIRFEDLVKRPRATADHIRQFVRRTMDVELDVDAMAACVHKRTPACLRTIEDAFLDELGEARRMRERGLI